MYIGGGIQREGKVGEMEKACGSRVDLCHGHISRMISMEVLLFFPGSNLVLSIEVPYTGSL